VRRLRASITAWWIVVNLVGWAVGLPAARGIHHHIMVDPVLPGWIVILIASWVVLAVGQWILLRGLPGAGWWILASAAGHAAGFCLCWLTSTAVGLRWERLGANAELWIGLSGYAALGLVAGAAQYVVLRRWVRRAEWWLPGSIVAAMIAPLGSAALSTALPWAPNAICFGALCGILSGALKGSILDALFAKTQRVTA